MPGTSSVAGTSINFPPGSLSVDTNISIEEGVPVAVMSTAAELSLGDTIKSSGVSVAVQAAAAIDANQPFSLSIALPSSSGLRLDDAFANLVVLYKVRIANDDRTVTGVIPRSEINIDSDKAVISTRYFGVYQTALLTVPVTAKKEVAVATPMMARLSSGTRAASAAPAAGIPISWPAM